jgi:TPR repeat protein
MEGKEYLSLCVQLYELSNMQRKDLSEHLKSRIFLYEECDGLCFEHLYELSDKDLTILLGDADIEQLAYAQLCTSKALQEKIRGQLSEEQKAELETAIERITPARLSVVEKARDSILGEMQDLVAAGLVGAVCIADPRINQICTSLPETLPDTTRTLSRAILAMDHWSVRSLLEEVREADLAGALLYMRDARVVRKMMLNLSKARAARLLDDLVDQSHCSQIQAEAKGNQLQVSEDRKSNEAAFTRFKKTMVELMTMGKISRDVETIEESDDTHWDHEYLNKHREAAQLGDVNAQYLFGEAHTLCLDFEPDYVEAIKWWRKAAAQQHAASHYALGRCYEQGCGVPQDDAEAAIWYRKAAELGHALAQTQQGLKSLHGEGAPQDSSEAATWFRKAAEQDEPEAQLQLGLIYRRGTGVPRDDAEAAAWFRKSADRGNCEAQYNLGLLYAKGNGVPKNEAEAAAWLLKAAEQGQVDAEFAIGLMYESGRGVPQDMKMAVKWIRRASVHGEEMAEAKLKQMGAGQ